MHSAAPTRPSLPAILMMAARPKTLNASIAPVLAGMGVALYHGQFRFLPALAALVSAVCLQIGANYANDVFDFQKGADTSARLGPRRVTLDGLLTPRQVLLGMVAFFGLASLAGIYLAVSAGWPVVVVGLLAIAAAILYTGGPFPLGYNGLGELLVFIFFGPVAVCGTEYVQAGQISPLAAWLSVPLGLLTAGILSVNNLRDIETDHATGKRTLAALLGLHAARWIYAIELGISYLLPPVMVAAGVAPYPALLCWASLFLAVPLLRTIFTHSGRPLNQALARTGQLELSFSLLFTAGLLVARLFA